MFINLSFYHLIAILQLTLIFSPDMNNDGRLPQLRRLNYIPHCCAFPNYSEFLTPVEGEGQLVWRKGSHTELK